jgi:hypothetical protein
MPYPPQVYATTGHAFGLKVNGVQVIDKVPTDLMPLRWDAPSATNIGSLVFSVLDDGETTLPYGAVVRLTDNRRHASHGVELITNGTFDSDLSGWTVGSTAVATWQDDLGPEGTGDGVVRID